MQDRGARKAGEVQEIQLGVYVCIYVCIYVPCFTKLYCGRLPWKFAPKCSGLSSRICDS